MRNILTFIFLILSINCFSQEDTLTYLRDTNKLRHTMPFEFFYGKKLFKNNFHNQFNTIDNFKLNKPITFLGLGCNSIFNVNRNGYSFAGHIALLFIIPENINIENIGSGKITGYEVSISIAGRDLLKKSKVVKLFLSTGINTGKIRIINNDMMRQRNLFLAPMVSVCPKLELKKFAIALNTQYDFDITNSKWKRIWFGEHKKVELGKFNQSGLSVFICLSYGNPIF